LIVEAVTAVGYEPGRDVAIARDPAASSFYEEGRYNLDKSGQGAKASGAMTYLYGLRIAKPPIVSMEDGLAENDWDGFRAHTAALEGRVQIAGDDIYVANTKFIEGGHPEEALECRADQAQSDRHAGRNHSGHRPASQSRLGLCHLPPLGPAAVFGNPPG
jgi:enolase